MAVRKKNQEGKLRILEGGRASEKSRYEVLFENAHDAIMVVDLSDGRIGSANGAALELTGYLREEIVGAEVASLFPERADSRRSQGLGRHHLENDGFFEDVFLKGKDGIPRFVSMSVRTIELEGRKVAMCILRDVAEKKSMERDLITKHTELRHAYVSLETANAELKAAQETLVQSGKLAALGELAAGIAHELNQPLTVIKGFAQEALALNSDPRVAGHLNEVIGGAEKMERIIAHLRNFTRKSTEDFEWVDVNAVIDESLVMLDRQLKVRGITVERSYEASLPKVYCNPFQLEQVFINLATNARDAIDARKAGRGKIAIATARDGDQMVRIRFEDDGCGIPEGVKAKIFNPFFTTKEVGRGMGLGLSISYGILARINASIVVESNAGKGTAFTVKIPVDYRRH